MPPKIECIAFDYPPIHPLCFMENKLDIKMDTFVIVTWTRQHKTTNIAYQNVQLLLFFVIWWNKTKKKSLNWLQVLLPSLSRGIPSGYDFDLILIVDVHSVIFFLYITSTLKRFHLRDKNQSSNQATGNHDLVRNNIETNRM